MEHLLPDYKAILSLFHDRQVKYLLVGGYAVCYYGYRRATHDLDLWTSRQPDNVTKIIASLRDYGCWQHLEQIAEALEHERRIVRIGVYPPRLEILDPLPGQRPEVLLSVHRRHTAGENPTGLAIGEQPAQIELLTVQSGVMFDDCFAERIATSLDGIDVNFISLRHLKILKQAGGRPQDLDDLVYLT